jgi:hypothetical protein
MPVRFTDDDGFQWKTDTVDEAIILRQRLENTVRVATAVNGGVRAPMNESTQLFEIYTCRRRCGY